jgi:hypothetical protein
MPHLYVAPPPRSCVSANDCTDTPDVRSPGLSALNMVSTPLLPSSVE